MGWVSGGLLDAVRSERLHTSRTPLALLRAEQRWPALNPFAGRCGLPCVNAAPDLPEFNHNPLEHFEMESRMSRYYDEWVSQSDQ